ncbi:hypothetical protein SLS53_005001 [Cytospora paraplurivora]|uniref:ubiquitinyl hydrolase 1 n=1 Tax=Cytospora paraplurivora TaxID=2898453 RepID=A0AAN9UET0_9PEZI
METRNAIDGVVNEERLFEALMRMCKEDSPAVVPLYISAQNAGILFRKNSNQIQLEAFELAPCNSAAMKPDILLCMSAKISRRLLKLNPTEQDPGITFIQQTLQRTRYYLEQKWTRIQALDGRRLDLDRLKALEFENDVSLSLPELDDFISGISERSPGNHSLEFSPSSNLLQLSYSSLLTNDLFATSPYMAYNLTAFEHWVASDLSAWLVGKLEYPGTCAALKAIMEGYHTAAKKVYSDNPEASSIMILTLIELWIACDNSAVSLFPMLRDYDPGVQLGPLQSLNLPSKEHLVRLRNVETYLGSRQAAVCLGDQGSIFRDYGTPNCFSVRFYNESSKHKNLRHRIEADANEERRQRCLELLQKQNRQLRSPAVDFKKSLTSLVVLQAIYQAGPRDNEDFRRASHSILANGVFPGTLLSAVDEAIGRIEKNWESYEALGIFTCIVARQLSLSAQADTTATALMVLSKLRNLGFSWLELLREKRDSTEDEAQRREFAEKIVAIALICSGTFDVDEQHLESILVDTEQASILIQCGIMINELYLDSQKSRYPLLSIHYRRWQRLSYRAYPVLARKVTGIDATTCLDTAMKVCWPDYRRMGRWDTITGQTDEWVVSNTDSHSGQSLRVHFNLLTGQLLVGGLPLSRLPDSYEQHDSYREIFGGIVLEIMPSSVAGFQFSAKQCYSGYSLHFGLDDPDMLVRAFKDDIVFDLIPKRIFHGKLPHTFSEDFVHWYDTAANTVEFRSSRQPWESAAYPWKLVRDGSRWKLSKREITLVNPFSPTGDELASILAPLQSQLRINITLAENGQFLEVELPRLKLAFSLEKGGSALLSRQFRGLEVDNNQSIGTLIGLKGKLVLRDPSKDRELKNEGHTNWDPMKYPDSLLLEVESDIMIREVQERIAAKMR